MAAPSSVVTIDEYPPLTDGLWDIALQFLRTQSCERTYHATDVGRSTRRRTSEGFAVLMTVQEFCGRVTTPRIDDLVTELQERTGRHGLSEKEAWKASLPNVAKVLSRTELGKAHVTFSRREGLDLEYRLPASSSWADAVLLGRDRSGPRALMIELKDWDTRGDVAGPRPGLVRRHGQFALHPSEQVRGYVEYCRRFHSAVHDHRAGVDGAVFLTRAETTAPYASGTYAALTDEFPVFCMSHGDIEDRFPEFLQTRITAPDEAFAHNFVGGIYRQDRSFVRGMADVILDPNQTPFVLLDFQRLGLERCLQAIEDARKRPEGRTVVVVQGPPGSGKSVLAAQLWARLVAEEAKNREGRSVVMVTTTACQGSNWRELFERVSGLRGGKGVVLKATAFNPGLSPQWVKQQRRAGREVPVAEWQENLQLWAEGGGVPRIPDGSIGVSIVDEAHALIDPSVPGKEGIAPSGWAMHAGPQAYHILRASKVSVFLMDSQQSYRDNETTSADAIDRLAAMFDVSATDRVSLEDSQFRCGGSKEYVDWLDRILELKPNSSTSAPWTPSARGGFDFAIVDDPFAMEAALREHHRGGRTVRLATTYNRPWKTQKVAEPHALPPERRDFHVACKDGDETRYWSKIWNYAPDQNYSYFIQAPPGSAMADDPLCEVGCPYVVRGFDYDFLGIIWGADLVWRNRWEFVRSHVHESAWKKTFAAAKRGVVAGEEATLTLLKRAYRILLTRAIRGVVLWFEDEETRRYVERNLRR